MDKVTQSDHYPSMFIRLILCYLDPKEKIKNALAYR